jgi:DNA repair protein RadC
MSCYVLLLTTEDKLLGFSEISSNQSMDFKVNYRELLQVALATNVPKIIIAYNRVDENYDITPQEIKNIIELKEYLLKVNITLKDYLLFTSDGFTDFQSDLL